MSARRERQLGLITPDIERYSPERASDMLDAIKKQVCPFCGCGPFTVVAAHVVKAHGINRKELRELLNIPVRESICDEFYSKARSAHAAAHARRDGFTPEIRAGSHPVRHAAVARLHAARNALILKRIQTGTPYREVAIEHGLSPGTIATIVRSLGFDVDGRRVFAQHHRSDLDSMPDAWKDRIRRQNDEAVARWQGWRSEADSGSDIAEIAARHGVRADSVKRGLKKLAQRVTS